MTPSLYYFNPITATKKLLVKEAIGWSSIYNLIGAAVGMNDRSGTLEQPIKLSILDKCKIPLITSTNVSYEDCLNIRAREIWEISNRLNKPIGIWWSGGIDSTAIVVTFLKNFPIAELKNKIKIITSTEATLENPVFYNKFILPNFEFISSEFTPWLFDDSMILVTGEFNDQLFGSDLIKTYLTLNRANEVNSSFNRTEIFNYINSKIKNDNVSNILINAVIESSNKFSIVLEKNSDFFWWYNFCFKWQAVHFRFYALTHPKFFDKINHSWDQQYVHHFFQTDIFQQWSMSNPAVRYIDDWKNYKFEAKRIIYEYDKNEDYFLNKIKRGSLKTVFCHRPVNEAITSEFKILEKYNPLDYYNKDNLFK